jgi:hypothetical protein
MSGRAEPEGSADVFAEYHRAEFARHALGVAVGVVAVAGAALPVILLGAVAPGAPTAAPSPYSAPAGPSSTPSFPPETLPAPAADIVPTVAPVVVADTGWSIAVGATGYQAELDACQWVRMDIGAVAPIVGAHTSCGGEIVLQMMPGQAVALSGAGLDGAYVVAESRDAHVGDVAATATAGMSADVILQTCYPGGDDRVRLVAVRGV